MPLLHHTRELLKEKLRIIYNTETIIVTGIFILYLLLRIISWNNVTTLDDHDSVSYLRIAQILENHQWEKLNPMNTFFYPVLIAAANQFNISYEIAARLVSLLFSIILFITIYLWGKEITTSKGVFLGLMLLSLNPFLINLSIAALTEPSYIALVYMGLILFVYPAKRNNISFALLCGIIFGLSFADRTEGIIFILFIPLLKIFNYIFWEKNDYPLVNLLKWTGFFAVGFSIIALPIIFFVSTQMHTITINGRTAWQKLLNSSDTRSSEEKLHGLDFSSSEININYILSHPDALDKKQQKTESNNYSNQHRPNTSFNGLKYFILDVTMLYRTRLSSILGVFVILFYGIGIYKLFIEQKYKVLLLILSFTVVVLIPPIMLYGFRDRHIAIVIPAFIIVSGIGLNELGDGIVSAIKNIRLNSLLKNKVELLLIFLMVFFSLGWFNDVLRYPSINTEYSLENYSEPLIILKEDIKKKGIEDPKISSRKRYFPYYAKADELALPYTNYDKLVRYFELNAGNYLFLEYKHIKDYPYLKRFQAKAVPDFKLLYSGYDNENNKIELYGFKKNY